MKKLIITLAIAVALSSCSQIGNNVSPSDQAAASARGFAVDGFGKGSVITADKLPPAALDYLTKTYPGYTFVQGVQGTDRAGALFFAAVIEQNGTRYHLHFDASGAILPGRECKGGPGRGEANETTITQDKLPPTILDYLTTTYAGYTFLGAQQAADSAGVVLYYEVGIAQSGKPVRLNFDATGKLLERGKGGPGQGGPDKPMGTSITADKLPAATTAYLTATYAGYTFKRAEQVTTRDGVTLYAVAITQNSTSYFLLFNADGSFRAALKKK